jgi:carbon storage regulator
MSQNSASQQARYPDANDVVYALVRDTVLAGARQRLLHSSHSQLWEIACDYYEGVLTLRGIVSSAFIKDLAHAAVVDPRAQTKWQIGWRKSNHRAPTCGFRSRSEIMLVLSRKRGEKIHIGSNIVVSVAEIKGNRVQLGFDCPPHVSVHRSDWQAPTISKPRIQICQSQRTVQSPGNNGPTHQHQDGAVSSLLRRHETLYGRRKVQMVVKISRSSCVRTAAEGVS